MLTAGGKMKKCEDVVVSKFPGIRVAVQNGPPSPASGQTRVLVRIAMLHAYSLVITVEPVMKTTIGGSHIKTRVQQSLVKLGPQPYS
jgi:hypothetical protein